MWIRLEDQSYLNLAKCDTVYVKETMLWDGDGGIVSCEYGVIVDGDHLWKSTKDKQSAYAFMHNVMKSMTNNQDS